MGESAKIRKENLLPRSGMMSVSNPPQLVSDLIDVAINSWKEVELRRVFIPIDVDVILSIPLCTKRIDDFWAWGEDIRVRFSAISAYRMLSKVKTQRWAQKKT